MCPAAQLESNDVTQRLQQADRLDVSRRSTQRSIRDTCRFVQLNRSKEVTHAMKKFGFASIVASGMAAAVLGLAAPAQAGIDHHTWLDEIQPTATVPYTDTTVHQSR